MVSFPYYGSLNLSLIALTRTQYTLNPDRVLEFLGQLRNPKLQIPAGNPAVTLSLQAVRGVGGFWAHGSGCRVWAFGVQESGCGFGDLGFRFRGFSKHEYCSPRAKSSDR